MVPNYETKEEENAVLGMALSGANGMDGWEASDTCGWTGHPAGLHLHALFCV